MLCKFWLHISPRRAAAARFEARERTPWKQYKITDEDYRNREKGRPVRAAPPTRWSPAPAPEYAPWTLVSAEDKRYARVEVLEVITRGLKRALRG